MISGSGLADLGRVSTAWSTTVDIDLKFDEIFPAEKALGLIHPFVSCMKTPAPSVLRYDG